MLIHPVLPAGAGYMGQRGTFLRDRWLQSRDTQTPLIPHKSHSLAKLVRHITVCQLSQSTGDVAASFRLTGEQDLVLPQGLARVWQLQ